MRLSYILCASLVLAWATSSAHAVTPTRITLNKHKLTEKNLNALRTRPYLKHWIGAEALTNGGDAVPLRNFLDSQVRYIMTLVMFMCVIC